MAKHRFRRVVEVWSSAILLLLTSCTPSAMSAAGIAAAADPPQTNQFDFQDGHWTFDFEREFDVDDVGPMELRAKLSSMCFLVPAGTPVFAAAHETAESRDTTRDTRVFCVKEAKLASKANVDLSALGNERIAWLHLGQGWVRADGLLRHPLDGVAEKIDGIAGFYLHFDSAEDASALATAIRRASKQAEREDLLFDASYLHDAIRLEPASLRISVANDGAELGVIANCQPIWLRVRGESYFIDCHGYYNTGPIEQWEDTTGHDTTYELHSIELRVAEGRMEYGGKSYFWIAPIDL